MQVSKYMYSFVTRSHYTDRYQICLLVLLLQSPLQKLIISSPLRGPSKLTSTQRSADSHTTMKGRKLVTYTHPIYHADSAIYGQDAFCKSQSTLQNLLRNHEVDATLLSFADVSVFWRHELLNLSLDVSVSLLEVLAAFQSVRERLYIISSPEFDSCLFFNHATNLSCCCDIYDCIFNRHKSSWHNAMFSGKSHNVFTIFLVG